MAPPHDRVKHFDHRVSTHHDRGPGRNLAVARRQKDRHRSEDEAQQVSAPIAHEDRPARVVDQEKPKRCACTRDRNPGKQIITRMPGNPGKGCEHHAHCSRGQSVDAINDVDRMGESCRSKSAEGIGNKKPHRAPGQESIHPPDIDFLNRHPGQKAEQKP